MVPGSRITVRGIISGISKSSNRDDRTCASDANMHGHDRTDLTRSDSFHNDEKRGGRTLTCLLAFRCLGITPDHIVGDTAHSECSR